MPTSKTGRWSKSMVSKQVGKCAGEKVRIKLTFSLSHQLNSKGFTLIELAVVIIVLSVASALVIPKLEGLIGGGNLKSSARRLVGTITYVHDQAATTGRKYRLCYDLDTSEYWVARLEGRGSPRAANQTEAGEFTELKTALGKRKRLLEGIFFLDVITYPEGKVNQGYTYTEFSPKGFIEKCTIHLQNDAEETCTLLIKSLTGRVKIYDHYVEESVQVGK